MKQVTELRKLYGGFQAARAIITANNLGLFEHLEDTISASDAARKAGTDERATGILLDALTGLGLIKKKNGRYKNAPVSSKFLIKGKPYYQGDIIRHMDFLWRRWSGLDGVVKTGNPSDGGGRDMRAFILGMHNMASLRVKKVIGAVGIKGVKTALDLGGGPGTYSMEMAKKGVKVALFDMPGAVDIAEELASRNGIKGIRFLRGDFISDDIGKGYDLIFISQILHAYSEEDNMAVIRKCKGSLTPGGRIAIQEFFINEERTHPPRSALFSVNMLIGTGGGRCYSVGEMKKWLADAGFKNVKERMLDETVVVQGRP